MAGNGLRIIGQMHLFEASCSHYLTISGYCESRWIRHGLVGEGLQNTIHYRKQAPSARMETCISERSAVSEVDVVVMDADAAGTSQRLVFVDPHDHFLLAILLHG